jgi:hypothetical protein
MYFVFSRVALDQAYHLFLDLLLLLLLIADRFVASEMSFISLRSGYGLPREHTLRARKRPLPE